MKYGSNEEEVFVEWLDSTDGTSYNANLFPSGEVIFNYLDIPESEDFQVEKYFVGIANIFNASHGSISRGHEMRYQVQYCKSEGQVVIGLFIFSDPLGSRTRQVRPDRQVHAQTHLPHGRLAELCYLPTNPWLQMVQGSSKGHFYLHQELQDMHLTCQELPCHS